jgi:hypothetical protein
MTDKIEYYRLVKYINDEIIKNLVKNNSKIDIKLFGGSSLKKDIFDPDQNFINIIGNLGKDFIDEIKELIISIKDIVNIDLIKYLLPIISIIYSYKKIKIIGKKKFKLVLIISILYIMFIIINNNVIDDSDDETLYKNIKQKVLSIWKKTINVFPQNNSEDENTALSFDSDDLNNNNNNNNNRRYRALSFSSDTDDSEDELNENNDNDNKRYRALSFASDDTEDEQDELNENNDNRRYRSLSFDYDTDDSEDEVEESKKNLGGGAMPSIIDVLIFTGIGSLYYFLQDYMIYAYKEFIKWYRNSDQTNISFFSMLKNILSGNFTSIDEEIADEFLFNESTGMIECNYNKKMNEIITNLTPNTCYLGSILMKVKHNKNTNKNIITYEINSVLVNSISYIESKPISTALIMSYLCAEKQRFIQKQPENYVYELTSDNNLKLYNKDTKQEIMSVSIAINQYINKEDDLAKKTMEKVCKDIFLINNNGLEDETCSKHFYSILGKSAILMLKNINNIVTTKKDIKDILINANPLIKYEILKNLNWKLKVNEYGKKNLISVEEWLKNINNKEFNIYLNSSDGIIKEILNGMIEDINTNSSFLDEKYKDTKENIINPNYNKIKKRLTLEQIKKLKLENLEENKKLYIGI